MASRAVCAFVNHNTIKSPNTVCALIDHHTVECLCIHAVRAFVYHHAVIRSGISILFSSKKVRVILKNKIKLNLTNYEIDTAPNGAPFNDHAVEIVSTT